LRWGWTWHVPPHPHPFLSEPEALLGRRPPGERGIIGVIWLENKIFNPKKCRGVSLGDPQKGGHTCLPVGREGRPYELINQFSWLLAAR